MGVQLVAAGEDVLTQPGIVVDLAVVDDDNSPILVGHRLMATRDVLNC